MEPDSLREEIRKEVRIEVHLLEERMQKQVQDLFTEFKNTATQQGITSASLHFYYLVFTFIFQACPQEIKTMINLTMHRFDNIG
jgi:hypothetical protein